MNKPILYDGRFFLEFTFNEGFDVLSKMIAALKADKDKYWDDASNGEDDESASHFADDPKWLDYLNETASQYFAQDKDAEEDRVFWELWKLTEPTVRLNHSMFNRGENWDFESLIESVFNGEYSLDEIRQLDGNRAVLLYNPCSIPFGGSESLVALIESFGHRVIYDYWHQGPHQRGEASWDYALARELVSQNKGFVPDN